METVEELIEIMKIKALKASYKSVGLEELTKEEKWDIYKYLTVMHPKDMTKMYTRIEE